MVGGSVYKIILDNIAREGILDSVTGRTYISHSELRRTLGMKCRIPGDKQVSIISELLELGFLELSKSPTCYLKHLGGGEIFYYVKKVE